MDPVSAPGGPEAGLRYGSRAGRWVLVAAILGSVMASIDATATVLAAVTIRDRAPAGPPMLHRGLDGPPARPG